jgi:uncharacterized membrane protein YeaQ/YmgE (transglycosylase-associated protein family)
LVVCGIVGAFIGGFGLLHIGAPFHHKLSLRSR